MSKIHLTLSGHTVTVNRDGASIGSIRLSDNRYHQKNCYASLHLQQMDPASSAELFEKLAQLTGRPIQVMVNSEDREIANFLIAGGCVCKRKCYETESGRDNYIGEAGQTSLLDTHTGDPDYQRCCRIMFQRYRETHEAINPWTATFSDFCGLLPAEVVFTEEDDIITNLAFVEENEIAYIFSISPELFSAFAASLISRIFASYETVRFESDDCDWTAMELKAMFANQEESSFDTYVYGPL